LFLKSFVLVCHGGCGKYPTPLRTAKDIVRTPAETEMLSVSELSLEHFPALAKFTKLKQIKFYHPKGTGASDEKLQALARLNFRRLKDINLLNCPAVTDKGLIALANISSLQLLQLEGTSITDASLEILAGKLALKGINVANCQGVTFRGLSPLAASETLQELTFSAENLSQTEVLQLISNLKAVKWLAIVDASGKLDAEPIRRAGTEKQINVSILRQGALQTMKEAE